MNLEIDKFMDAGLLDTERVILKVVSNDDLGQYALFKTKRTDEKSVDSMITTAYWFPNQEIKKGDIVVVYTKAGIDNSQKNESGSMTHFQYWGKTAPLWKSADDSLVVLKTLSWRFKSLGNAQ